MSPRAIAFGLLATLAGCGGDPGPAPDDSPAYIGPSVVAYGNGVWVGLQFDREEEPPGLGGELVLWGSTDGVRWRETARYPDLEASGEVTFANGMFMAIVASTPPAALRSDDGVIWTRVTDPPVGYAYGIAGADGRFVAFVDPRGLITTTDGSTWTEGPDSTKEVWRRAFVVHVAGRFFAYGDNPVVLESVDAVTWQGADTGLFDTGLTEVSSVGAVDGSAVAFAEEDHGSGEDPSAVRYFRLDRTPTGWTIQQRERPRWVSFVEVDATRVVAVARTEIAVSDDRGATWRTVHDFDSAAGKQVASDGAGTLVATSRQPMFSLDRGETWAPVTFE